MIKQLEMQRAGWWWSISQSVDKMRIAIGPDRSAHTSFDRKFMQTRTGDFGFIRAVTSSWYDSADAIQYLLKVALQESMEAMLAYEVSPNEQWIPQERIRTTPTDYTFISAYTDLIQWINAQKDMIPVQELYIGSCYRSADLSLYRQGGYDDITLDLKGDATLVTCMQEVLRTPRPRNTRLIPKHS